MDRKVFFSDGGVIISDSRFIASGYIYNIRDIISVRLGVIEPQRWLALFSMALGLVLSLTEGVLFVVGGGFIALGIMAWIFAKTRYAVILKTATGDHHVLLDTSSEYIGQVTHALDAAMINRGALPKADTVVVRKTLKAARAELPPMLLPLIE